MYTLVHERIYMRDKDKACQHMKQLYAKLMYTRCKLVPCPSGNIT